MKKLILFPNWQHLWLFALCLGGFVVQSNAQDLIAIDAESNNYYTIQLNSQEIHFQDLVYLRFSDGTHMTSSVYLSDNVPTVTFTRQFNNIENGGKVHVYLVRKNGPILYKGAYDLPAIMCNSCVNPTILNDNDVLEMTSSWNLFFTPDFPFFLAEEFEFTPPTTPFFFLNVAFDRQKKERDLNIILPPDMQAHTVFIEDESSDLNTTFTPTNSTFCESVELIGNIVKVNFKSSFEGKANVYVVVTGEPVEPQYTFRTIMGSNSDALTLRPNPYPTDPNGVYPINFRKEFCELQSEYEPLHYFVKFQNVGSGVAENVIVNISIDNNVLDAYSFKFLETNYSHYHTGVSPSFDGRNIKVKFANIHLPGMSAEYPQLPNIEATKGWFEFTIYPKTCFNVASSQHDFTTGGHVLFECTSCGPGGYTQTTYFDPTVSHAILHDCTRDIKCKEYPDDPVAVKSNTATQEYLEQSFTVNCYPTLFDQSIEMNVSGAIENQSNEIQLIDITGKMWLNKQINPSHTSYQETLSTNNLPTGMYILQVRQGDELHRQKIIKQ